MGIGRRRLHVLILYNDPVLPTTDPNLDSEREILNTVDVIHRCLADAGCFVSRLALGRSLDPLTAVFDRGSPDIVFNLFEGLADSPQTEAVVALALERAGVPFTGCPSRALHFGGSKHLAKELMQKAGLPTPRFKVLHKQEELPVDLRWPLIVKPSTQDASIGIDQNSVVTSLPELERRVSYLLQQFGPPVLVEEFVVGREFSLTLIERASLVCLPPTEIRFIKTGDEHWPIFTYDGKWKPGSPAYEATPESYPAELSPALAARLSELARHAFRLFGCRDYGRVDFRVTSEDQIHMLEINPNADLNPDSYLGGPIWAGHVNFIDLILRMVGNALRRTQFRNEPEIMIRGLKGPLFHDAYASCAQSW